MDMLNVSIIWNTNLVLQLKNSRNLYSFFIRWLRCIIFKYIYVEISYFKPWNFCLVGFNAQGLNLLHNGVDFYLTIQHAFHLSLYCISLLRLQFS